MKAWNLLLAILISFIGLGWGNRANAEKHPIVNAAKKAWSTEYGDDDHVNGKRKYHAVRLNIKTGEIDGNNVVPLTADLYLFGKPMGKNYKYERQIQLSSGHVKAVKQVPPNSPTHYNRALIPFVFAQVYKDEENNLRFVKVVGTFHAGKRNHQTGSRDDDRVSFSFLDEPVSDLLVAAAMQQLSGLKLAEESPEARQAAFERLITLIRLLKGSGVPCDDYPPIDAPEEPVEDYTQYPHNPTPLD